MSVSAIDSTSGGPLQCDLSTGAAPVGPAEILAYVQAHLGDIDSQIKDFMDQVDARNKLSEDIRAYEEVFKGLDRNGTGYNSGSANNNEQIAIINAAIDKISDPELKARLEGLKPMVNSGSVSHDLLTDHLDYSKNRLATLNADNEIIMMKLQSLIQLRTQIVQLCSNALASFNEGAKATIANIRG